MKLIDFEIPTREEYERLAYEYMAQLPLEHYMEGESNAAQRLITAAVFRLVSLARPEVKLCNELLVQYPRPNGRNGQVVPDAMVVIQEREVDPRMSYNVAYEDSSILIVMEYVSPGAKNQRKDYEINRDRYERELKVPYYVLFDANVKKLTVLELRDSHYEDVQPDARGRYPIDELDLELAIVDGWVRFWLDGKMVPLPEEQHEELEASKEQVRLEKSRADSERSRADLEAAKAAKLAAKLKALGIDPDE